MSHNRSIAALALACVASLGLAACGSGGGGSASNGDTIKLGFIGALTGPAASYGQPERAAAEAVVANINKKGGVLGKKLELDVYDDATDPTKSARGVQKLVDDGVVGIVGPNTGGTTLAAAPVSARLSVPLTPMAGTLGLTDPKNKDTAWTFRVSPSDEGMIPALFDKVASDGNKTIAILAEESAYGEYGTQEFKKLDKENDKVEIRAVATAASTATDLTPQATKLRGAGVDAVVLQTQTAGLSGAFLRAAKDVGLDAKFYGGMGLSSQPLIDAAGAAADGLVTLNMVTPDKPAQNQQELYNLLKARGDTPTYGFADLQGANAVLVLVAAIKHAGKADPEAIKKALESGIKIDAYALAPYQYSKDNHDGLSVPEGITWTRIENGKYVSDE